MTWHGTTNGYVNRKCRCQLCRDAWAAYRLVWDKKQAIAPDDRRHGTSNGYGNYNCRCQDCRDAWAQEARGRRLRKRASA